MPKKEGMISHLYICNALIIMDGVEINNLKGINTSVKNGSQLIFLSVTHGG